MLIEKLIKKELEYFEPMLKRQIEATDEQREIWRTETVADRLQRISLETYDMCGGKVVAGPFEGLRLNKNTWWGKSDLGSQCLGLYEKEILDLISSLEPFELFVDIGAADGYYVNGMLHAEMAKQAICYEVSLDGQRAIKENWIINRSPGKLLVHGEANDSSINLITSSLCQRSLVLIDIEGYEFTFLTQKVLSVLKNCNIILEIHNWVEDFPIKYATLLRNLNDYFDINIIHPKSRDTQEIPCLRSFTDDNRMLLTSERRPCLMRFLHLEPKS